MTQYGTSEGDTTGGSGARHWGVGRRLAVMIVLALLPLGMLAMQQTASIVREVGRNQEMAAMGATVQAASAQIRMIQDAQVTTRTLAVLVPPYLDDITACRQIMDQTKALTPAATLVAFTPMTGLMTCASDGNSFDFSASPLFQRLIEKPEPKIVVNPQAPVSGAAVVGVAHPVFDARGRQIGIVSMSLRHESLGVAGEMDQTPDIAQPIALVTFDRAGNLLTASTGLDDASLHLPRERSLAELAGGGVQSFTGPAVSGFTRLFSVVPLTDDLFLLGTWRVEGDEALVDPAIAPFLLPGLMWLAALSVAVFAAEHLVTRHVRLMSQAMLAFARGDRGRYLLPLRNPPAEIADLAEAYRTMTATILRDGAELENLVHQKDALLREVHHRTGNSLQLIASVLRMHLREQPDDGTRKLLENLHSRVMSLSTVHLSLYRIAGDADVAVHELMADVITKVSAIHDRYARTGAIEADLGTLVLPTEQAVPMALLLAEVLSCFPASEAGPDDPPIRVMLDRCDEGGARMRIAGPVAAEPILTGEQSDAPARIAARLIRAFVGQLGGDLSIAEEGSTVVAEVTFRIRAI